MKHRILMAVACAALFAFVITPAIAQEPPLPIPISSMMAYDAVELQIDPLSGEPKKVMLVDTRTRAEFFWIGTTARVDEIQLTDGKTLVPDMGKVMLLHDGMFLQYRIDGRLHRMQVAKVDGLSMSPIARNIPYKIWNESTATLEPYGDDFAQFTAEVEALARDEGVDVVIFFCRSGGRSQDCLANFNVADFDAVYEIDQPDGKSGRGGFEGTTYGNVYNGYRGFPLRMTWTQTHESVAWKDAGLPIKIGVNPLN